jgi:diguanylate cyclase (GGDEF)-like protein/PAS domain S-box-containing protein
MSKNSFTDQELAQLKKVLHEKNSPFSVISSNTADGIVMIDENEQILFFNIGAEVMFGYNAAEVMGQPLDFLFPSRFAQSHQEHITRFKRDSASPCLMKERIADLYGIRKSGEEFPVEVSISKWRLNSHVIFTLIWRDITERIKTKKEEEHNLALLRATLESTADGILAVDKEGKNIIVYNNQFLKMWHVPQSVLEAIKKTKNDQPLLSYNTSQVKDPETFIKKVKELYNNPTMDSFDMVEMKDGRVFERHSKPQLVGKQNIGRVWSFRDVTDRFLTEERLKQLANFDSLTGLPNRALLFDRLNQAMARANRARRFIGVMFLDLDRFKNVNDSLGHDSGDLLLKAVADRLSHRIRDGDTIARLGGDEFIFILDNIAQPEDTPLLAQKILLAFSSPFHLKERELFISASIGISVFPTDGQNSETLLKNADTAMYRAKERGKNQFQLYSPV